MIDPIDEKQPIYAEPAKINMEIPLQQESNNASFISPPQDSGYTYYFVWPIAFLISVVCYIVYRYWYAPAKYLRPENPEREENEEKEESTLEDYKDRVKQYIRNIRNNVVDWKDYFVALRDKYWFRLHVDKDTVKTAKYKEDFTTLLNLFTE